MLASLAKWILTIPASSSKSERVFSTGGNIVTAKRNRLSPKNVESLIVIKENMAMVNDFMQNGGYIVKNFETFASIDMEEKVGRVDDDEFEGMLGDIEDEDIIFLRKLNVFLQLDYQ